MANQTFPGQGPLFKSALLWLFFYGGAGLHLAKAQQAAGDAPVPVCNYYAYAVTEPLYLFPPDDTTKELVYGVLKSADIAKENFTLSAANVSSINAVTIGDRRMILYNQEFFQNAHADPKLKWKAIAILSHQIAHHVMSHNLADAAHRKDYELQADYFSGQVLFGLGASESEAVLALEDSRTPGLQVENLEDRLKSIRSGWTDAQKRNLQFTTSTDDKIPRFPWPPPQPSAKVDIPISTLVSLNTGPRLADVDERLRTAFTNAGYVEVSYYAVPEGFAIVSRLERFKDDGTPEAEAQRWRVGELKDNIYSLGSYFRSLLTAPKGRYRVVVFMVTPVIFAPDQKVVEYTVARDWLWTGSNGLPSSLGILKVSPDHKVTALIYEFELTGAAKEAVLRTPGSLTGKQHLEGSKLWQKLGTK